MRALGDFAAAVGMLAAVLVVGCSGGGGGSGHGRGAGGYPRTGLATAPKIVNVSAYDPKERQRSGEGYTATNVAALKRNGALGLIARVGKGREQDSKFSDFLGAAQRQNLLLGSYYFVLKDVDPVWQADRYVERLREVGRRQAPGQRILLVGDFDSRSTPAEMIRFIDRIESRTGVLPVVYLENSPQLRKLLSSASPAQKARLRQCPYWLALYSHDHFKTPGELLRAYNVWDDWAMWQYAGVEWDRRQRRSVSKHFNDGPWRAPAYFGTMDRPLEHNAFHGSHSELGRFWARHSWVPR